jgi:hypothetical protein
LPIEVPGPDQGSPDNGDSYDPFHLGLFISCGLHVLS